MDCCFTAPEKPCISVNDVRVFRLDLTSQLQPGEIVNNVTVSENSPELAISNVRVVPASYYSQGRLVEARQAVEATVSNQVLSAGEFYLIFAAVTLTDTINTRIWVRYGS